MKKYLIYALFFLSYATILFFWWSSSGVLLGRGLSNVSIALGRLAGLSAAYFILLQFVFIGRSVWIEQTFGLDKLTRIHHWNGLLSISFILAHPTLIIFGYAIGNNISFLRQFSELVFNNQYLLQAFIALLLFCTIVGVSLYIVRKRLKYESWYTVHLFTYLAILLAWGHQLTFGEDFLHSPAFVYYWYALYIFAFGNLLYSRFMKPLLLYSRHQFFISRTIKETADATSIYISGKNMEHFHIKPGQFMIFRFLTKKFIWQAHPFSLSYVVKNNEIRITVKKRGDFTEAIQSIKAGTKVFIDGPYGIFTRKSARRKKFLFIAGGIGITPIRALFEEAGLRGEDAVLLYNNRAQKDVIFKEELEVLSGTHHSVHYVMSEDPDWKGISGKITMPLIETLVKDFKEREIYLCGPGKMMTSLRDALREKEVAPLNIHFELFSLH